MKLIVGLGNPELKYFFTPHNTGFWCIDTLLNSLGGLTLDDSKYNGAYIKVKGDKFGEGCEDVIIAKPLTYMNLSGEFIAPIAKFYKIDPKDIIVIHDEIAINEGRIKLAESGSAAGHNGIKDIIKNLGTEKFNRIRVGIGPVKEHMSIIDYVLYKYKKEEFDAMKPNYERAAEAAKDIIVNGMAHAMNVYNTKI